MLLYREREVGFDQCGTRGLKNRTCSWFCCREKSVYFKCQEHYCYSCIETTTFPGYHVPDIPFSVYTLNLNWWKLRVYFSLNYCYKDLQGMLYFEDQHCFFHHWLTAFLFIVFSTCWTDGADMVYRWIFNAAMWTVTENMWLLDHKRWNEGNPREPQQGCVLLQHQWSSLCKNKDDKEQRRIQSCPSLFNKVTFCVSFPPLSSSFPFRKSNYQLWRKSASALSLLIVLFCGGFVFGLSLPKASVINVNESKWVYVNLTTF